MENQTAQSLFIKNALTGVIYGSVEGFRQGFDTQISIRDTDMKVNYGLFQGGLAALGSFAGDIVHDRIFPLLPKNAKLDETSALGVAAASTAGAVAVGNYIANPKIYDDVSMLETVGLAIAAELGSTYLYEYFLSGMLG